MKILKFIVWLTVVFSAGCSQRHYIAINPHVPVTPHNFSKPKPVGLKVIDARSGNKIANGAVIFISGNSLSAPIQTSY